MLQKDSGFEQKNVGSVDGCMMDPWIAVLKKDTFWDSRARC